MGITLRDLMKMTLFLLFITLSTTQITLTQSDIYRDIEDLVDDIEYLSSRGVDVSQVIRILNEAHELIVENRLDEAKILVDNAKNTISQLHRESNVVYQKIILEKVLKITSFASLPFIVYFTLPRIYLYLWYRPRRKWLVSG